MGGAPGLITGKDKLLWWSAVYVGGGPGRVPAAGNGILQKGLPLLAAGFTVTEIL